MDLQMSLQTNDVFFLREKRQLRERWAKVAGSKERYIELASANSIKI